MRSRREEGELSSREAKRRGGAEVVARGQAERRSRGGGEGCAHRSFAMASGAQTSVGKRAEALVAIKSRSDSKPLSAICSAVPVGGTGTGAPL